MSRAIRAPDYVAGDHRDRKRFHKPSALFKIRRGGAPPTNGTGTKPRGVMTTDERRAAAGELVASREVVAALARKIAAGERGWAEGA